MLQVDDNPSILYTESTQISLTSTTTRCWMRIGQQQMILTPGIHAKRRWN